MTEALTSKPSYPADPFAPWPRIPVDRRDGGDFHRIQRAAAFAAVGLMCSPEAPPMAAPRITVVNAAVEEALLYLLELGLIDIDAGRLEEFSGKPHPPYREGRA